jgi:hypothetical protein
VLSLEADVTETYRDRAHCPVAPSANAPAPTPVRGTPAKSRT